MQSTFNNPRLPRCPHCGVGRPQVVLANDYGARGQHRWAVYSTTCCHGLVLAQGNALGEPTTPIDRLWPDVKRAAIEIPDPARTYLQQALETLHAPDAAAVMAGSAVDAMLKHFGLIEGNVYTRIAEAVAKQILTQSMGRWANEVRLGSNRPRHADNENPHVTSEQAAQSVEFAEALGYFLFVLTSRIEKGMEAAKKAEVTT